MTYSYIIGTFVGFYWRFSLQNSRYCRVSREKSTFSLCWLLYTAVCMQRRAYVATLTSLCSQHALVYWRNIIDIDIDINILYWCIFAYRKAYTPYTFTTLQPYYDTVIQAKVIEHVSTPPGWLFLCEGCSRIMAIYHGFPHKRRQPLSVRVMPPLTQFFYFDRWSDQKSGLSPPPLLWNLKNRSLSLDLPGALPWKNSCP